MLNGTSTTWNDYDVGSLHIPYGPGWDARRIDKLIYQTVSASDRCTLLMLLTLLTGSRDELCVLAAVEVKMH